MKKLTLMLVTIIISFCSISQTPQAFKYQAVARDNTGNVLANQNVSFQISILEGSTSGAAVYVETHDTLTNEFGLVNLEIGNGVVVSGVFEEIDWGGNIYFLQIEMDENGGEIYQLMGTSQLLSVPFALYAESSGDAGATQIDDLLDAKTSGYSFFLGENAGVNDNGYNWNTGVGTYALNANVGGQYNTSVGHASLDENISGSGNTAIGTHSMSQNTSGNYNAAFGRSSLQANSTGNHNTGIGNSSLSSNGIGNYNTAIGYKSNYWNQTGSNNTIIGCEAGLGVAGQSKSGSVFLGYKAGYNENGNNKLYIENSNSSSPLIYGEFDNDLLKFNGEVELANDSIASSLKFYESDTSGSNFTKFQAQNQSVDVTYILPANDGGNGHVLQTDGSGLLSWTEDLEGANEINDLLDGKTANTSVYLGLNAGLNSGIEGKNAALGRDALYTNVNGVFNTAIGYKALYTNVDGQQNTASGCESLFSNTSGQGNTATGRYALYSNTEGIRNTASGLNSLYANTTGNYNEAIGSYSLNANTTGNYNVSIGSQSLYTNDTGSYNTCIGYWAGYHCSGSGNVFLGAYAGVIGGNNRLVISNSNSSALIYGEFDNKLFVVLGTLDVNNEYQFPLTDGTNGQILQTDGSGTLSWNNKSTTYSVGDFTQGGIVFWVDETSQHGLVCTKEDQSTGVRWYAGTNGVTRATGDGPFSGEMNTVIIIAAQVAIGDDGATYAAHICNELQITEGGKTYGDWYLPSKEELNLMYQYKDTIDDTAVANGGSAFASAIYWSSTEGTYNGAYRQYFSSGGQLNNPKSDTFRVRAVRAF